MKSMVIALVQPAEEPYVRRKTDFLRKYGVIIFMTFALVAGVVFGAVRESSSCEKTLGIADKLLMQLPLGDADKTPVTVFAESFCVPFLFTAALCFLAVSPSGLVAIPALMFFRGCELGFLAGYLCVNYGFSGLAYYISVVLGGAFLSSLALLYISQYCLEYSASLLLAIFGSTITGGKTLRTKLRDLTLNGAYSLMMTAFASLTDTLLYFLIGRLFSFA